MGEHRSPAAHSILGMCGIAGIVSNVRGEGTQTLVQRAARKLAHRGPESEAFWNNEAGTAWFGHRRLCVLDLSEAAAQPMRYADRYTIVYNGEIYNYIELKQELETAGRRFRSQSDTEVILAAYAQWGAGCLLRFDGAFAFAVWDEKEQTLFAARDRFGEKPFFFCFNEERLLFASEIKALWTMGVRKEVNASMLYNFITIGYTANPADGLETFYNGVSKLPAAHYLTYSVADNKVQTHRWWQVYVEVNNGISESDAVERFMHLFRQSIRWRLRSDVAIGTSLSGGLDSSSIVAFCAETQADQYTHKCFTASFAGFAKDETTQATLVAKSFNLQHHFTTVNEDEVVTLMDTVAAQQDEPFSSASALAQYKVFELAKQQGVTVLLDGQGADEVLAGYHKYYKWWWGELHRQRFSVRRRPLAGTSTAAKSLSAAEEVKAARTLGIKEDFGLKNKLAAVLPEFAASMLQSQKTKEAFRHPDLHRDFAFANKRNLYYATPTHHTLNGALYYNTFTNGLEELLRLADRNSMAHGVEVRLPFSQHELVEFLFTLPAHFKIHEGWTKWLLRKAVDNKLPKEIVWRRDKVGYEPPQKAWMQNKEVQERIVQARRTLVNNGVLNKDIVRKGIAPKSAHEEGSYDWRYWSAAALFV